MNQVVRTSLEGEILPPGDQVSVYGTTSPLNAAAGARIYCRVPAGCSIMEILLEALASRPGLQLRRDFIVRVGGVTVPESEWSRVRVKSGQVVTFVPRLQGGSANNQLWASVLAVVVAVAAAAVSGPWGAAFAASAIGTAIGISATVASALIAGGIILAGSLLINALFPVRPPAIEDSSDGRSFNSIQGARNSSSPFGSIPVVLGRHRQSPYYAAKPYTLIVGDDQYVCMMFCWGYGPLLIEDLKIGETPLSSFADVQIQNRQGFVGDPPITLYPSNQFDEASLSIELDGPVDGQFQDGIFGPYNTQTTSADTDEIGIDFTAPNGVFATDQTGKEVSFHIKIEVQYRAAGLGGAWSGTLETFLYRATEGTRVGMLIGVARGQYEVRCRRATGRGSQQYTRDTVLWTALRSIKHAPPITFPKPLALTAVRIRASGQLSGVVDTFNGINTSLVNAWDGADWVADTASQWPPDLFRHVLQGPANARPRPDSAIDLESLQEWKVYCIANGLKFNQIAANSGGNNVFEKLCDIAAAGRAFVTFTNGKWGVVWDRPGDPIVDHFTPRNSWDFGLQRAYAQQPHGWRVPFINERNGFTADERIVYDDGYDASNATLFEGIEFAGVTDPDLIWKHGRFHIAQARLRPEKFTLSIGWENLVCTRGDRVLVTHDVPLIGLAAGRIKSVVGQVITFDEKVTIESGKTYGFTFRVPEDIRSFVRAVDDSTPAGDYSQLTLIGDLSLVEAGTLWGFGETGKESAAYRIQNITHQKNLVAVLTLVDDAPAISTADTGTIPEYTPNITIPPDPFTLPPRDLRYQEIIDGQGATARAVVHLTWQVPRFGNIASFEVQSRFDDSGQTWLQSGSVVAPNTSADVPIDAAGFWSFRVRCVFTDGTTSAWAEILGVTLAALSAPPGDIINLHQHSVDGQTVLDWDAIIDQRQVLAEARKGTSWDTGLVVGNAVTQPPWPTTGDGTYHVRAYVLSPFGTRIYSLNTASIDIEDSIISRNIILSRDEQATGWTGSLEGGVIDGSFIRTDTGLSISAPWAQEIVDQLALTGLHIAIYASPTYVDIGRAAECRFWTLFEASGVLQGDDFLGQGDVLGSGDLLGVSPTRFILAFPVWRFAATGAGDVFDTSDVFTPADVFSADIDWGDWVATASGTRVERYFQPGYVLITNEELTNATGTKFEWFVDVPDRNDDYTQLTVPNTGLDVTFYTGGYSGSPAPGATPVPFNGGPNGAAVPHVQRAIVDGNNGDEVKITNLTLSGCTVHVVNAGVNVTQDGVNLLVRGY